MSPPKRKCVFNSDLQKEYPYIKKTISDSDVRCNKYSSTFSISHWGEGGEVQSDISQHINSEKQEAEVIASIVEMQELGFGLSASDVHCKAFSLSVRNEKSSFSAEKGVTGWD